MFHVHYFGFGILIPCMSFSFLYIGKCQKPQPTARPTKVPTKRPTRRPRPKPKPKPNRRPKADKLRDATHSIKIDLAQDVSSKCLAQSYDVALKVIDDDGVHFLLTATATDQNESDFAQCPKALAFASVYGNKVTYLVQETEMMERLSHAHILGKATLKDIVKAVDDAEAVDDSKYDLTKNSCIHYAGNIWRGLEFEETNELADFLIQNLLSDDGFLDIAREKVKFGGLRVLSKFMTDNGMFEKYVQDTVFSQLNIKE